MNPFIFGDGVYHVEWDNDNHDICLVHEGRVEGSTAALMAAQHALFSGFKATHVGEF
jgi:hypothetical protein